MKKNYTVIKPPRLHAGDSVMLIAPSHQINPVQLQLSIERLEALKLNVIVPEGILDSYGYFAGSIEKRANDINTAFQDAQVRAIFAVRGGSGASLLLEHLDYQLIKANPKILMGFSDVTALLVAIYEKTGLITFHGPTMGIQWPAYTVNYMKQILFDNKKCVFNNPCMEENDLIKTQNRTTTLYPGQAQGILLGGNLTVLATLIGSAYFPQNWKDAILFIEDVGEETYRIDRMLAQFKNAGILSQLKGLIAGTFQGNTHAPAGGFHLNQVLERYILPLKIPAFSGAMIGHQSKQFILGEGMQVLINANSGEIAMQECVVT